MTTTRRQKTAFALLAGLSLTGALAGCSTEQAALAEEEPATVETSTPTAESTAAAEASTTTYVDGTYTATGSYQSPNGTESVEVTVTLDDDVITAVTVVSQADNPESSSYQADFISGISAVVVGQDIDSISVSRVAGSSLTSGGFNAAIETIKSEAA